MPSAAADAAKSIWYEFTPPATGDYLLTSFGSSFDTVLTVYTGTWPTLTEVGSSDNIPQSLQAQLTLSLDTAHTYYIQLSGRQGSGHFEFRIADPADEAVPSTPMISATAAGAPSTPVANNTFTNHREPVLAWEPRPAVTPYAYFAEVSTDPTFSSITESGLVQDPTHFLSLGELPIPVVPSGQKYYWRVAALNFLGQTSTSSPAYNFTLDTALPAQPALYLPTLNSVLPTLRPKLTWQPISDAVGYRVIIATNFSASTPYLDQEVNVTAATYTPPIDIQQGEYWFAVQSRDAAGNLSGKGEKRRFVINLSQTPVNGNLTVTKGGASSAPVTLTWTKILGATYTLQIATDSSFSVFSEYPNLSAASFTATGLPIGTYYWRVAVNGQELPISLARSYSVTPPLPEAPLVQTVGAIAGAVADKAGTKDQSPNFDWTVPANWAPPLPGQSMTYEFQLATDSKFTQVIVNKTGLSDSRYEWDEADLPPTPGTTYYWPVRAVTNLQLPGAYSKVYSFTLDTEVPEAPVITSPVISSKINRVVTGQRPVIKWKAVKGAARYRVIFSTNFSGTSQVINTLVNGTTFTPSNELNLGTHWIFADAQDAAGNVRPIQAGRGLTVDVSLNQTPAQETIFIAKAPANSVDVVFNWERKLGVSSYRIDVSLDGDTSFTGNVHSSDVTDNTYTLNVPATRISSPLLLESLPVGNHPSGRLLHVLCGPERAADRTLDHHRRPAAG